MTTEEKSDYMESYHKSLKETEEMMHTITVRNQIFNNVEGAVLEMHEWDKKQFIKLVIEWLEGVRLDYYSENFEEFIEDFKEYAEEKL